MELTEKTLESREIFRGRIVTLKVDKIELPDGHQSGREVVEHPGGVAVLPLDDQDMVGLEPEELTYMGCLYASPGFCTEVLHMYLARGLKQGACHPDEGEFLERIKVPFEELVEQVMNNEISDAKTVAAVLKAKVLLGR